MKDYKINATIALATVVAALLMVAALSFAIGKWSFGNHGYELIIKFPNATGITPNSELKYAGAHAGRVKEVRLIPRKDQTIDPNTRLYNCVEVVVDVDTPVEIGDDVAAYIKQDGFGISAKYVLLTPGPDHDSKPLTDGAVIQGEMPFDLSDLIQPAGEAMTQAKNLITKLGPVMDKIGPVMDRLDTLSAAMERDLPSLITNGNKFLVDGDGVIGNLNTPESRKRINDMLANLRVSTENLKVVSTNAKALTATLAEKPWRVFWGGSTVKPPTEAEILKSDDAIRLKPDVDVSAAPPEPETAPAPPAKK